MTHVYTNIAGGYRFAVLRAGVAMQNAEGRDVYFQPGDGASAILDAIEALDEVPEERRATIADMVFGDYFA